MSQEKPPSIAPYIIPGSGLSKLAVTCQWLKMTLIDKQSHQVALVALNYHHKLYLNGYLIASNCTSFWLNETFLMFTTLVQTVRLIPLSGSLIHRKFLLMIYISIRS
jgi:hypothetical protein